MVHGRGGGGVPKTEGGVYHHPTAYTAGFVRAFGAKPDSPRRASGEGLDGSDPPRLLGGSLPSYLSLREGSHDRLRPGRRRTARTVRLTSTNRPAAGSFVENREEFSPLTPGRKVPFRP